MQNHRKMKPKQILNNIPTQKELCERIGWNVSSMSLWLNGHRDISDEMNEKLKKVLKEYGYE